MPLFFSASRCVFLIGSLKENYINAGNWPDDAIEVSEQEKQAYSLSQTPIGKQLGASKNGRPCWVVKTPEPLADVAQRKRRAIESAYAAALRQGVPYTMPDGTDDVIQTRPEDESNLLGLAIEARDLRDAGETTALMELRAQSNTVYELTPAQMIDATDTAKAFKKSFLRQSWQRKGEIAAALEAEDRDALEAITW